MLKARLLTEGRVTNTSQRPLLEIRIKYNTSPLVYFLETNDHEKIINNAVTAKCLSKFTPKMKVEGY